MHKPLSTLHHVIGLTVIALFSTPAQAEYEPNDSYTSFVVSFQSSKFATPVCINGECHEFISGPALSYTKQVIPNLAFGLAGSQLQSSGKLSSIKSGYVAAFVEAIAGLGRRFDVGTSVAALSTSTELCSISPDACSSSSDNGSNLGVFGKAFLTENRTVSLTLGYNAIAYQKSPNQSIISLALVSILAKHHRFAFSMDRVRDASGNDISGGLGFGYSYLIYY